MCDMLQTRICEEPLAINRLTAQPTGDAGAADVAAGTRGTADSD